MHQKRCLQYYRTHYGLSNEPYPQLHHNAKMAKSVGFKAIEKRPKPDHRTIREVRNCMCIHDCRNQYRDQAGVGMVNETNSPRNQHQFSRMTMGSIG